MGLNFFDVVTFIIVLLTEVWLIGDILIKVIKDNVEIFTKSSPMLFPFMLSVVLGFCLILLFVRLWKQRKIALADKMGETQKAEGTPRVKMGISKIMIIFLILLLVYSYILPIFHFILATILYVIIGMILINEEEKKITRKIVKPVIIAVIAVPIIYYVFYNIFEVIFP